MAKDYGELLAAAQKGNKLTPYQRLQMSTYVDGRTAAQTNKGESDGYIDSALRAAKSTGLGMLGGLSYLVGAEDTAKQLQQAAQENARRKEFDTVFDWNYVTDPEGALYDVAGGLTSMAMLAPAAFLLPESAAAGAAGAISSGLSRLGLGKIGTWAVSEAGKKALQTGVRGAMTAIPESVSEWGNTAQEAAEMGMENPRAATVSDFAKNMAMLPMSNALEYMLLGGKIFNKTGKVGESLAKRIAYSPFRAAPPTAANAGQNAVEEFLQQSFSDETLGKPTGSLFDPSSWTPEQRQSLQAGGVVGGVLGGVGAGKRALFDTAKPSDTKQQQAEPTGEAEDNTTSPENPLPPNTEVSSIQRMRELQGKIPYEAEDGTNCMRTLGIALAGTPYAGQINVDQAIETAKNQGQLMEPDKYVPRPGDIAVVEDGNHAVMITENGGTIQNGASHNGVYESDQSPLEMFGKVKYYIRTSDYTNGPINARLNGILDTIPAIASEGDYVDEALKASTEPLRNLNSLASGQGFDTELMGNAEAQDNVLANELNSVGKPKEQPKDPLVRAGEIFNAADASDNTKGQYQSYMDEIVKAMYDEYDPKKLQKGNMKDILGKKGKAAIKGNKTANVPFNIEQEPSLQQTNMPLFAAKKVSEFNKAAQIARAARSIDNKSTLNGTPNFILGEPQTQQEQINQIIDSMIAENDKAQGQPNYRDAQTSAIATILDSQQGQYNPNSQVNTQYGRDQQMQDLENRIIQEYKGNPEAFNRQYRQAVEAIQQAAANGSITNDIAREYVKNLSNLYNNVIEPIKNNGVILQGGKPKPAELKERPIRKLLRKMRSKSRNGLHSPLLRQNMPTERKRMSMETRIEMGKYHDRKAAERKEQEYQEVKQEIIEGISGYSTVENKIEAINILREDTVEELHNKLQPTVDKLKEGMGNGVTVQYVDAETNEIADVSGMQGAEELKNGSASYKREWYSNNAKWYRDWYKLHGKPPTKAELYSIAEEYYTGNEESYDATVSWYDGTKEADAEKAKNEAEIQHYHNILRACDEVEQEVKNGTIQQEQQTAENSQSTQTQEEQNTEANQNVITPQDIEALNQKPTPNTLDDIIDQMAQQQPKPKAEPKTEQAEPKAEEKPTKAKEEQAAEKPNTQKEEEAKPKEESQEQPKPQEKQEYKYYLNQRPASIGAVPNGFTRIDENDKGGRYGAIYYPTKLDGNVVKQYELVSEEVKEQASRIDDECKKLVHNVSEKLAETDKIKALANNNTFDDFKLGYTGELYDSLYDKINNDSKYAIDAVINKVSDEDFVNSVLEENNYLNNLYNKIRKQTQKEAQNTEAEKFTEKEAVNYIVDEINKVGTNNIFDKNLQTRGVTIKIPLGVTEQLLKNAKTVEQQDARDYTVWYDASKDAMLKAIQNGAEAELNLHPRSYESKYVDGKITAADYRANVSELNILNAISYKLFTNEAANATTKTTKTGAASAVEDYKHTQTGEMIAAAKLDKKFSGDDYKKVSSIAKENGGYYSRFAGKALKTSGLFLFKDGGKTGRDNFVNAVNEMFGEEQAEKPVENTTATPTIAKETQAFADAYGLDANLLQELRDKFAGKENAQLNEYGKYDKLIASVDKAKAKAYIEEVIWQELAPHRANMKIDASLRGYITKGTPIENFEKQRVNAGGNEQNVNDNAAELFTNDSEGQQAQDSVRTNTASPRPSTGNGQGVRPTGSTGSTPQRDNGISGSRPTASGTTNASESQSEVSTTSEPDTGSVELHGSVIDSYERPTNDTERAESVTESAPERQTDAAPQKVSTEGKSEREKRIIKDMPFLKELQAENVEFAYKRLEDNAKQGAMITDGTGTGKTFSYLAIAQEALRNGKNNILIIAPSNKLNIDCQKTAKTWFKDAKGNPLQVSILESTKDAGSGVVCTTYANAAANDAIVKRDWDMVICDEAHNLMSSEQADVTTALKKLRMITMHRDEFYNRAEILIPDSAEMLKLKDKIKKYESDLEKLQYKVPMSAEEHAQNQFIREQIKALQLDLEKASKEIREKRRLLIEEWKEIPTSDKPKVLFLTATPFAYVKNIEYAEGYLFEYPKEEGGSYNQPNGRQRFFMEHFGYRMRFNKLTKPDAKVDNSVMEIAFHDWLRKTGALIGHELVVDQDYKRAFLLVKQGVGAEIDKVISYLHEHSLEYDAILFSLQKNFTRRDQAKLLESIKAKESIPIIKQYLKQGKKVVVFYDTNKAREVGNPFTYENLSKNVEKFVADKVATQLANLAKVFPKTLKMSLDLKSPLEIFQEEFGSKALFFNGKIPPKQRNKNVDMFQDDNSGKNLIIVQKDAGNSGLSLHDETGKHQRALIVLGTPARPTYATQIEGRIYRTNVKSNAIIRYLTTGTSLENFIFATTIAGRASTAENLAMGSKARALRNAYVDAYQKVMDGTWVEDVPGAEGEDVGGKEIDKSISSVQSEFDVAKSLYYGQQKKNSSNKAAEGQDYFATPEPIGYKMVQWAKLFNGNKVLEPSAGHGAISRFFSPNTENVIIEPSGKLSPRAAMNTPNAKLITSYFESHDIVNKYDAITMNPPFGTAGKTAMEHIAKAFKHLRNNGRLVAIVPRGKMDERFDKWYNSKEAESAYLVGEVLLPSDTFNRAGTSVATRILIIDKHEGLGDQRPDINFKRIDLSSKDTVEEVFNAIENLDFAPRENIYLDGKSRVFKGTIRRYEITQDDIQYSVKPTNDIQYSIAYHGTPHKFNEFDMNRVGSGQGLQMYGWGMYFAQEEDIAQAYRQNLSASEEEGQTIEADIPEDNELLDYEKTLGEQSPQVKSALQELMDSYGKQDMSEEAILEAFDEKTSSIKKLIEGKIAQKGYEANLYDNFADDCSELASAYLNNKSLAEIKSTIFDSINEQLQFQVEEGWVEADASSAEKFSKQIVDEVVKAVKSAVDEVTSGGKIKLKDSMYGDQVYKEIARIVGTDKDASLLLNKYGIKGLTYNGGMDGKCFVLFDETSIKILRQYMASNMDVETIRPKAEIEAEIRTAFPNGTIEYINDVPIITLPNGVKFQYSIRENIIVNQKEQKKADAAHGTTGGVIQGFWQKFSGNGAQRLLAVAQNSQRGTAFHESMHAAVDLALTEKEKTALRNYYQNEAKKQRRNVDEVMADAYRDWVLARQQKRGTVFGKLWQKIKDFCIRIKALFDNGAEVQRIMQDIESGRVYERGTNNGNIKKRVYFSKVEIEAQKGSGTTQRKNTRGMYVKALSWLRNELPSAKTVLDYGAGLGLGTEDMRSNNPDMDIECYEPNPQRWQGTKPPTYTNNTQINKNYDLILNTNVLNVVEKPIRDLIVKDISSHLNMGGKALITTRAWNVIVNETKNYTLADEYHAVWVNGGKNGPIYQKGFDAKELKEYLEGVLGNDFTVERTKPTFSNVSVVVTRVKPKATTNNAQKIVASQEMPDAYKTLKGSAIKRSKYGVGKQMGSQIYLHKGYATDVIPQDVWEHALKVLNDTNADFKYNCVMYDSKSGNVRFDEAPDFDTAREPIVGDTLTVKPDGTTKRGHSNYIWHHKWIWVKNDYKGFDVNKSKAWSQKWLGVLTETADGNGLERWNAQLDRFGLEHDNRETQYSVAPTQNKIASAFTNTERKTRLETAKDFFKEHVKSFYSDMIDKNHILKSFDELTKSAGGLSVYEHAQGLPSTTAGMLKAITMGDELSIEKANLHLKNVKMKHKVTLAMVLDKINKKAMDEKHGGYLEQNGFNSWANAFGAYLGAKRLLEMGRIAKSQNEPYSYPKGLTERELAQFVGKAPKEFAQAADMFYKVNDNVISIMEDAQVFSPELAKTLRTKYRNYCPLLRDFSDTAAADSFIDGLTVGGRGIGNVSIPLKKISINGSERGVLNPLETTLKAYSVMLNRAERNKVGLLAVSRAKATGLKELIEEVPEVIGKDGKAVNAVADPKNCIFTVLVNGKKKAFKTTQELYTPIVGFNLPAANLCFEVARMAAHTLRTGATMSPSFIVRNFLRDTIFAGISSKNGFKPFVDSIRGAWALLKNPELRAEFEAAGVTEFNFFSSKNQRIKSIDQMTGEEIKDAWTIFKGIFDSLENASAFVESSTRMGEFMRARKNGLTIEEAARAAREVTLDFSRSGRVGEQINQFVPFFNACLQGGDKMYRLFREDPMGTSQKVFQYIVLPSIILMAMNWDKDWYKDLDPDIKSNYWCISDKVRIPKPQEAGVLFGSGIEALITQAAGRDKEAVGNTLSAFLENMLPNIVPTLFLPLLEWQSNYNYFKGRQIVGNKYKNLPDELQYSDYTSEAAKGVGSVLKVSPMKVDNLVRGYTGTMGAFLWSAPDFVTNKAKDAPTKKWYEYYPIRDFTVTDSNLSRPMNEFYDLLEKVNKQHAGYGKKGEPNATTQAVRKVGTMLSNYRKEIERITKSKGLTPDRKRELVDIRKKKMNELAKRTIEKYKDKV